MFGVKRSSAVYAFGALQTQALSHSQVDDGGGRHDILFNPPLTAKHHFHVVTTQEPFILMLRVKWAANPGSYAHWVRFLAPPPPPPAPRRTPSPF